jgi:hypothetical protein
VRRMETRHRYAVGNPHSKGHGRWDKANFVAPGEPIQAAGGAWTGRV